MTDLNGGQLAARQLKAAGIDAVFGVVAGPMIEILSGAVEEGLTVVNCRHEVSAGLMASSAAASIRLFLSGKTRKIVPSAMPAARAISRVLTSPPFSTMSGTRTSRIALRRSSGAIGAARRKMRINARKYPVRRAKGNARKYSEL